MKVWLEGGWTFDGIAEGVAARSLWVEMYSDWRKKIVDKKENAIVPCLLGSFATMQGRTRQI